MTRIVPAHEQQYPSKLLPHRLEEYVFDDGRPPTQNRAFAKRVTGPQVIAAIAATSGESGNIDPRYYVGTCFHESGATNEWDTEIATASCPPGFVSVGAYQIGREEALRFGFALDDMLELDKATACMIALAEANRRALRAYAAMTPNVADPDYTDPHGIVWTAGTMRAYLAIAHNHGLGYAKQTILNYGMSWAKYKARNPQDKIVSHGYGEDCVTGGPQWPHDATPDAPPAHLLGSRVLKLTHPWTTGFDVGELQRHLKISADSVFGPMTEQAVITFQKAHGIVPTGVVDATTATALECTTIAMTGLPYG